jgi:hypothetical protein
MEHPLRYEFDQYENPKGVFIFDNQDKRIAEVYDEDDAQDLIEAYNSVAHLLNHGNPEA